MYADTTPQLNQSAGKEQSAVCELIDMGAFYLAVTPAGLRAFLD